jgi:plasmid stability protein
MAHGHRTPPLIAILPQNGYAMASKLKTVTIRLDENLHRRLKVKLIADGTNFQAKTRAMLEEYVDGSGEEREEIARQVAIAREAMRRYAPAMRKLAR